MLSGGRCDRTAGIIQYLGKTGVTRYTIRPLIMQTLTLKKEKEGHQRFDNAKKLLSSDAANTQLQLDIQELFYSTEGE